LRLVRNGGLRLVCASSVQCVPREKEGHMASEGGADLEHLAKMLAYRLRRARRDAPCNVN
jgi:hypothetical protein